MGSRFQRYLIRCAARPVDVFSGLLSGGLIFTGGFLLLVLSNRFIAPSLEQELAALAALVIMLAGGILWFRYYLSIILVKLFLRPPEAQDRTLEHRKRPGP